MAARRAVILGCASAAAAKKDGFLKGKFWRIVTKSGGEKAPAIIAVAHTLLLLVYQVLQTKKGFEERTAAPMDEQQKKRLTRHHIRAAGQAGFVLQAAAPSGQGRRIPGRLRRSRPPSTRQPNRTGSGSQP